MWEIKQRVLVDMAADRGAYIDQSQSFNVHMSDPNFGKLTSLHFYGWKVRGTQQPAHAFQSVPYIANAKHRLCLGPSYISGATACCMLACHVANGAGATWPT